MTSAASIKDYIGSKVSLISASDVRYEGCLYTIDPDESTVALQRVRCMGTEYRRTGDQAIPPSDTTYEFIIFRGEHIKSLHVAEDQRSPSRNEQNPDMMNLLNFSPTKGDKRGGARSNGVHVGESYQDNRGSPPKRFVGIAPQRRPQYDDYSRPMYDSRRSRRSSPPNYRQGPPPDTSYGRGYGHYGPPAESRGYGQGYRGGYDNRRRGPPQEQQWGGNSYYQPNYSYQSYPRRPRRQRGGPRGDRRQGSQGYNHGYQGGYQNYQNYQNYQRGQRSGGKRDVVPGQGGFLQKVGQTKGEIQIDKEELFDIYKANEGFDKKKLKEEVVKRAEQSTSDEKNEQPEDTSTGLDDSPKKYDMPEAAYSKSKTGFFDSLSTDRDQKVDKEALKQQRKVDEDTFGEIAKNYMSRHNRRRGGGGGSRRWGGVQRGRQQRNRRVARTWTQRK